MPQRLKAELRDRIATAALAEFAARGFKGATMAAVARRAGVSAGNLYRYYPGKAALFDDVVPPSFARTLRRLVRRRVRALAGVRDVGRLGPDSAFRRVSDELLAFSMANRQRVAVLIGRADGTRHEGFARSLVADLRRLAISHFRGLGRRVRVTPAMQFALDRIYRDWAATMVEILSAAGGDATIRERVEAYSRYHLAGLNGLFS